MFKSVVMALLPPRTQIFPSFGKNRGVTHLGLRFHAKKPTGSTESAEAAKRSESTEPSETGDSTNTTGPVMRVLTGITSPVRSSHESSKGVQDIPGIKSVQSAPANGSGRLKDSREGFKRVPGDKEEALSYLIAHMKLDLSYLKAQFHVWLARKFSKVRERSRCFLRSASTETLIKIADCRNSSELRTELSKSRVEAENKKCIVKFKIFPCEIEGFIRRYDEHKPCELYKIRPSDDCRVCETLEFERAIISAKARILIDNRNC